MNRFRQNPFLGALVTLTVVTVLTGLWLLWSAHTEWAEACSRFENDAAELSRLQRQMPFPSVENLRKIKAHAQDYGVAVTKLKEELSGRVLPIVPVQPAEFQSRLRVATAATLEQARTNKVKVPANFLLGFEEFSSALPDTVAAPGLAQELAQVEMIVNLVLNARVDSVTSLKRIAATAAPSATPSAGKAATVAQPIERSVIEISFISSPTAMRRALNAIASADKQFYIIRLLDVRNEKDKGPARDAATDQAAAGAAGAAQTQKPGAAALNFIVGNEKIETAARIEMLKFNF